EIRYLDNKEILLKYYKISDSLKSIIENKDYFSTLDNNLRLSEETSNRFKTYLAERKKIEEKGLGIIIFAKLNDEIEKNLLQVIVEHLEYLRYPGAYSTGYKLEDEKYPLLVLSSQYLSKYGKLKFLDEELRDIPFLSQELNKTIENSVKAQEFGFSQNEGDTNFELLIALCVLSFPIFSIFLLLFSVFPFQVFINTLTVSIILGFVIFFISQFLGPMIESFVLIYLGNDDLYLFAGLGITTYLCVIVYLSYYYFSKKPDKVFF
ncbi:MAG: hypothetical protein AAF696_14860, partial [Bacteroidota bacterium]